ncbi:MAG: ABC transporter ATP-binding protein [Phycisphaeraceae bacterium]
MNVSNNPGTKTITVLKREEQETEQRPLDFGLIRRLMRYTRPYAAQRNWLFFIVVIRSIQLPLLPLVIGWTIKGPINNRDVPGVMIGAIAFGLLSLFTQWVMHYRVKLALNLGERVVQDLRADLFRHIQTLPMAFFNRMKLGRILSRMLSDVEAVRVGVQDVLFVSLVQLGQGLVAAAVMAWYDIQLFCVIAVMVPVLWAINRYFRVRLSRGYRIIQESFSRVTATLAESVSGIRVTQGFVRQDVNAGLFGALVEDHGRYNVDVARTTGIYLPLLEFNNQVFLAILLIGGGFQVMRGWADVGDIVIFFFMAGLFFQPVGVIGQMYNQALTAMAGAERVFRLLDTKPDWTDPPDAVDLPTITGKVEFQHVHFSYVKDRPVLHDISFVAEPGQTLALVGETGSGKSSIINLISKFYLPDGGRVLIDSIDITTIASRSLHRQMGIVLQQNFLFTGTVMSNIRFGKPDATDDDVREAARRLDCLDILESLPDGLNTQVGERGGSISLGQRQLICFTRAMLANPRILILDEATSSVDTMTEARIQKALERLLENRTNFVVAHRLSTIRNATCVLVLEDGRIVERGTHNDLLVTGGIYANLYRQFLHAGEA